MHEKKDRRCVACRTNKQQQDMLRVTKIADAFEFDPTQKKGGRGAYVCKTKDCIELTRKKRLFNKAFKCNVPSEIYEGLEAYEQ